MDRADSVTALVLAAGASSRMGQPKPLLAWGSTTLLRHVTGIALQSSCKNVFVVLGCEAERLRADLDGLFVNVAETHKWREGMSASLRAGVEAARIHDAGCSAVLVMLVDQPHVSVELLEELLEARRRSGMPMVASRYAETLGPPAIFDASLFDDLLDLEGDNGAKALLLRDPDAVAAIDFPEGEIDLDRPQDVHD